MACRVYTMHASWTGEVCPQRLPVQVDQGMPTTQVVVLDKLDYCASVHNLDAVKEIHNFKVRSLHSSRDCSPMCGNCYQHLTIITAAVARYPSAAQLVKGDIQSGDLLGHLLRQHDIDTVMHFAAQVEYPFHLPPDNLMSTDTAVPSACMSSSDSDN